MPRVPRYRQWAEEAAYHVINRGYNRQTVFTDDEDRQKFLELLERYPDRYGLGLYHDESSGEMRKTVSDRAP